MERSVDTAVCSTIVDEALERQVAKAGQVCSTIVDELLEAQLSTGELEFPEETGAPREE